MKVIRALKKAIASASSLSGVLKATDSAPLAATYLLLCEPDANDIPQATKIKELARDALWAKHKEEFFNAQSDLAYGYESAKAARRQMILALEHHIGRHGQAALRRFRKEVVAKSRSVRIPDASRLRSRP